MVCGVSRRDFLGLGSVARAALIAGSACKDLASGFVFFQRKIVSGLTAGATKG